MSKKIIIIKKTIREKRREEKISNLKGEGVGQLFKPDEYGFFKDKNLKRKNGKLKNYIKNETKFKFSIILFFIIISNINTNSNDSEIKMIIKGKGTQRILNDIYYSFWSCSDCKNYTAFKSTPSEIYVNNQLQNYTDFFVYNLQKDENEIIIKWNYTITNCAGMFSSLNNITYIDLSKFDSSQVTNMMGMFNECKNLTSINFNNFNTQNVKSIYSCFGGCKVLTSLNLYSFDTSLVTNFEWLFENCINLKKLNIFNFDSSSNTHEEFIEEMFKNVNNLAYCIKDINKISSIFNRYPYPIHMNCSEVYNDDNYFYKTTEICPENYNKLIEEKNVCINNCYNDDYFIYEEYGKCVSKCKRGFYNDTNNPLIKKCKCELEQCLSCSLESLNKSLCTSCEEGYFPTYKDENEFLNCSKLIEGYYYDPNDFTFKKCYESCKKCNISGNEYYHNCIECKLEYKNELLINNNKNCYIDCLYYHYNHLNKSYCTLNDSCPINYNKLIPMKNECISDCNDDKIYKYEFRKICYDKCPYPDSINNTDINKKYFCKPNCSGDYLLEIVYTQECVKKCGLDDLKNKLCIPYYKDEKNSDKNNDNNNNQEDVKAQDLILESVEEGITSKEYNTSKLDRGENEVIETEKMKINLTTTLNQNNNTDSNETAVYLGECEDILRKEYNIPKSELIYIKKIDIIQVGMKIPKVEYDVYSKLNGTYLIKLNLSFCQNSKVVISVPVIISENIDILNISSGYYNDICYVATSDSSTDITLKDRKEEFINKNKTVCQEDCDFTKYNYNLLKANCSCKVKQLSSSFANMNIDTEKIFKSFGNIKNIANLNLLSCYKVLFTNIGILKNIGSILIIIILVIHLICIILYFTKSYSNINNKIKNIIFGIKNWKLVKVDINEQKRKKIIKLNGKKKKKNKYNKKQKSKMSKKIITKIQDTESNIPKLNKKKDKAKNLTTNNNISIKIIKIPDNNPPIKKNKVININDINQSKKNIIIRYKDKDNKFETNEDIKEGVRQLKQVLGKTKLEKIKFIMKHNDEELNKLEYKLALKLDKRTYCQYYISLLKTKHILIFSFCNANDYNSKIIKIDLFFIGFVIYFTVNGLFFSDSTMHKIYEDEGDFNILYQLPQIIYSSLISLVFYTILKFLSLSEDGILAFKRNKSVSDLKQRETKLKNQLNIKFIIYFILSTILLLFCWYYISMFCAIYRNTQIHLISDTLISFGLSLLYPLGYLLLPGFFRIPSLSDYKKNSSYLYTISKIIQMF